MHGGDQNRGADDDADGRPPPPRQDASSIRDRVSFSSSSRPRPSCWGRLKIRRIGRSSTHGRRSGIGGGGGDENGTTTPAAAAAASSRACLGGGRGARCGCRAVPDAAVGARSLLQRNDFYCDDCNTHR
ncbi:hypothetical protein BS78_K165200 [Paspalum vaginatum]|uniref:Uncharacterized protein n=1 Tax=Paspalum vaginatum TaxID=158149 RepID=A0A9W8CCA2_9POAL|nr:hypothetical protein BS78_K165200 [Paspalum vaginatum]